MHCTALHLHCTFTALHCTALQCSAVKCSKVHCTALKLYCTALQWTALHCTTYLTEVHCSATRCTEQYCAIQHVKRIYNLPVLLNIWSHYRIVKENSKEKRKKNIFSDIIIEAPVRLVMTVTSSTIKKTVKPMAGVYCEERTCSKRQICQFWDSRHGCFRKKQCQNLYEPQPQPQVPRTDTMHHKVLRTLIADLLGRICRC